MKFVVRLLTADDALLGWAEVYPSPAPQPGRRSGYWRATGPTLFPISASGTAAKISVHWCDLDVARVREILEPVPVHVGQLFAFHWMEPIWLVSGMGDVPLPPVTVGESITVTPPVGALAAVGTGG